MHEYLVRTINIGLAVKRFNDMLEGIEIPAQAERAATTLINKLVPSYAAVAVAVTDDRPASISDLNAVLIHAGLSSEIFPTRPQLIESTLEKVEAVQENRGDRVPPEAQS
jgi:hypothetical protein